MFHVSIDECFSLALSNVAVGSAVSFLHFLYDDFSRIGSIEQEEPISKLLTKETKSVSLNYLR